MIFLESPRFRAFLALLTLSLLILFWGCRRTPPPDPDKGKDEAPTFTIVTPQPKVRDIEQPAQLEAYEETPLVARIAGYVHQIGTVDKTQVDINTRVKGPRYDAKGKLIQGEVLAELWVPELEKDVRQKEALVDQAKAEVTQAEAALQAAVAHVATATALIDEAKAATKRAVAACKRWKIECVRFEILVKNQALDVQTLDETRHQCEASEATLEEMGAKVKSAEALALESAARKLKAEADVEAARARVKVADAERGRAETLWEYRLIRAPFDGVVTKRNVHTGHFLQPATGNNAQPLFIVAQIKKLRVWADIPEAEANFISDGMTATVRVPALQNQQFKANVKRQSWSIDAKARTLRVEMDLENPKEVLRPGMYATVSLRAEFPKYWTLPAAVVLTQGDQPCFFLKDGDKARRTLVQIGERNGNLIEVVKKQLVIGGRARWENLTGKEAVLQGNLAGLTDGQTVLVK